MTDKKQYGAYQRATHTVDEIKQVIMLYEGTINYIKQAKEAIKEKNYEKRYNLINKAVAIINGLNSCLEFNDQTQETSEALDQYYQDIDLRLLYINCNDSLESCDEIIADLQTMLSAWIDIDKDIKSNNNSSKIDEKNQSTDLKEDSQETEQKSVSDTSSDLNNPEKRLEINI